MNEGDCISIVGTLEAGVVQIVCGATVPNSSYGESLRVAHIATVTLGRVPALPLLVTVSAWTDATANAFGASAAAVSNGDGSAFDIVARMSGVHTPHTIYAWSYAVTVPGESQEPIASTGPAAGAGAVISVSARFSIAFLGGSGTVSVVTGDPPMSELGSNRFAQIARVRNLAWTSSGGALCLAPANAAAASIVRPIAIIAAFQGFELTIAASPPQSPLWPHTKYTWSFKTVGLPRNPVSITPSVWLYSGLGCGGAARVTGTDMAGTLDILFGKLPVKYAKRRASTRGNKPYLHRWRVTPLASVVFASRYADMGVGVQLTCIRAPEWSGVPFPIAVTHNNETGFDVVLDGAARRKVLSNAIYSWSYLVVGTRGA